MNRLDNICRVYEPQILKTMGIAFDAAWDVLSEDRKNREGMRPELSRLIFRLVDAGETDAVRLCKLALDTFRQSDMRHAKMETQPDLAFRTSSPSPAAQERQDVRVRDSYFWVDNSKRVGSTRSA